MLVQWPALFESVVAKGLQTLVDQWRGHWQWRQIALAVHGARGLSVKVKTVSVAEKFYLQVFIGLLSEGVLTFFYN